MPRAHESCIALDSPHHTWKYSRTRSFLCLGGVSRPWFMQIQKGRARGREQDGDGDRNIDREGPPPLCSGCSNMTLARSRCASEPRTGDIILVFRPQWLSLVLSGRKTLDVRGTGYKSGRYYLGSGGVIYAQAHLGHAFRVSTLRHFKRHQDMHRMLTASELPYQKTYLIPILSLREIKRPYTHPRGAISIVRYVPPT